MANKKTVVQMYEEILALPNLNDEQKAFIAKRIEITQKKNAKRDGAEPTPKQKEKMAKDDGIKAVILSALRTVGKPTTVSGLMKSNAELGAYSNQKISALLTQMLEDNTVERTVEKGKSLYALPVAE
jgi:hypothetical protein